MSLSADFLGSEIQQAITFSDTSGITADFIITSMEDVCNKRSIPVAFRKDIITSGTFFNKKRYECVIVNHPNPPQEYAAQVYVLIHNTILFHFFGNSKAFREKNEHEKLLAGNGTTWQYMKGLFKQSFGQGDNMALEIELAWHGQVIDAFNSLVY